MARTLIRTGTVVHDAWCVGCNASTAVRIDLHTKPEPAPPDAVLSVCANCGNYYLPAQPVVTIEQTQRSRPRPWLAVLWWWNRHQSRAAERQPRGCAHADCLRPGWWDCAWYEAIDGGRIRWLFCSTRHRAAFMAARRLTSDKKRR